jgi:hypothetical protein
MHNGIRQFTGFFAVHDLSAHCQLSFRFALRPFCSRLQLSALAEPFFFSHVGFDLAAGTGAGILPITRIAHYRSGGAVPLAWF